MTLSGDHAVAYGMVKYSEYTLQYEPVNPGHRLSNSSLDVIQIGDLSIDVDLNRCLVGFDQYTNPRRWREATRLPPQPALCAGLQFEATVAGDVISYDCEPWIEVNPSTGWVRVVISELGPSVYAQCGEGLLAGVSSDGYLVDLWLHFNSVDLYRLMSE